MKLNSYTADVVNYSDYYPFGMLMPNRYGSDLSTSEQNTYGFNGMEKDDEVRNGNGNSYDFGARVYDPRIGRWLSGDPLEKEYPSHSMFNFALNTPLIATDPNGEIVWIPVIIFVGFMTKTSLTLTAAHGTAQFSVNYFTNGGSALEAIKSVDVFDAVAFGISKNYFSTVLMSGAVDFSYKNQEALFINKDPYKASAEVLIGTVFFGIGKAGEVIIKNTTLVSQVKNGLDSELALKPVVWNYIDEATANNLLKSLDYETLQYIKNGKITEFSFKATLEDGSNMVLTTTFSAPLAAGIESAVNTVTTTSSNNYSSIDFNQLMDIHPVREIVPKADATNNVTPGYNGQ